MLLRREERIRKYILILLVILVIVIIGGMILKNIFERSDPEYYNEHFQKGGYYLKEGSFDLAVQELQKAVKARPESGEAHYTLAVCYLKQERLEEAARSFERADNFTSQDQNIHWDILYFLRTTYQRMGKWELALEEDRKLIQKDLGSYEVFNNMGMIYGKLGDHNQALHAFNHAIKLNPSYYEAYLNRAYLYEAEGKIDLASKDYQFIKENAHKSQETERFVKVAIQRMAALKR